MPCQTKGVPTRALPLLLRDREGLEWRRRLTTRCAAGSASTQAHPELRWRSGAGRPGRFTLLERNRRRGTPVGLVAAEGLGSSGGVLVGLGWQQRTAWTGTPPFRLLPRGYRT